MNIVFMINIVHDERSKSQGYNWSIECWKEWCKINNCELFVLDQKITDIEYMAPQWYKVFILDILRENEIEYDQVMYVDSDTIIHPSSPNPFDISERKFCAVPVFGSMDWVCRSIETYSKYFFNDHKVPFWKYFNSGLMIFNDTHYELFKEIQEFYQSNQPLITEIQNKIGVGKDQPVLNYFIDTKNVDYKMLPYEFNMQDLNRSELIGDDLLFTKVGHVYHFNAGIKPTVGFWLEKTYKELYDNIS